MCDACSSTVAQIPGNKQEKNGIIFHFKLDFYWKLYWESEHNFKILVQTWSDPLCAALYWMAWVYTWPCMSALFTEKWLQHQPDGLPVLCISTTHQLKICLRDIQRKMKTNQRLFCQRAGFRGWRVSLQLISVSCSPHVLAAILPAVVIVLSVLHYFPFLSLRIHLSFILPPVTSSPSLCYNSHNWFRVIQYSIDRSGNNACADKHFSRLRGAHAKCAHGYTEDTGMSLWLNVKRAQ